MLTRAYAIMVVLCLLSLPAMALQIQINSPAENTEYDPGATVDINVRAWGPTAGIMSVSVTLEGVETQTDNFEEPPPYENDYTSTFSFTAPNQPGATLLVTAKVMGWADESPAYAYSHIKIKNAPDTTAPTYSGTAGVKAATRLFGNASATIEWYEAQDNRSAAGAIKYNVYTATTSAAVFTGSAAAQFTGVTSGTIDNLNPTTSYYVGVRAVDEAGNEEKNTRTVKLDPLPNAAKGSWALYE